MRLALSLRTLIAALAPALLAGGCNAEGGLPEGQWSLSEIDGAPFPARATLGFPEPGRAAGDGPCNTFSAKVAGAMPGISFGRMMATRRACPELALEQVYFTALARIDRAEVDGPVLTLSGTSGQVLVFRADP